MLLNDLNGKDIIGTLQKINQQEFRIEKVIKKKGNKLYVKRKGYDNSFNSWIDKKNLISMTQQEFRIEKVIKKKGNKLYVKRKRYDNSFDSWIDKKDLISMSQYFLKPYEPFGGDINVKVGLSNYATKTYLKNVSHVDVSSFALKLNLAILKTEVDKLDIN